MPILGREFLERLEHTMLSGFIPSFENPLVMMVLMDKLFRFFRKAFYISLKHSP
jgi:hypothetical protein